MMTDIFTKLGSSHTYNITLHDMTILVLYLFKS